MSGIMMILMAGGGHPVSFGAFSLTVTGTAASGSHTGTFLVNTDGSISHSTGGTGVTDTSSANTKWYDPITTGVGSSFYVKFHLTAGTAWTAGLVDNTVYDLSVQRSLAWTAAGGTAKTATVAVTFYSDSGGTNQVASGTLTVNVDSTG